MARETFTWFPESASELDETPKVNVVKYGDGYEARFTEGVNTLAQTWVLKFTDKRAVALQVRAFLKRQGAVLSFIWTNPFGEQGIYVCDKWTSSADRGKLTVSATFRQVFEE